jgi:hypothetical protein
MPRSNPETFTSANTDWNLEELYTDLAIAKERSSFSYRKSQGLTATEKLHLRGLLCGYSPAKIATKLFKKTQSVEVDLCRTIYLYVKELTGHTQEPLDNWRKIVDWLTTAGYKKTSNQLNFSPPHLDWGAAPEIANFYGRTQELIELRKWLTIDRCKLVNLLGMGGIGKTALAVQLVENIHPEFDYVVWQSLANNSDWTQLFQKIEPDKQQPDISSLLDYLRAHRCLIVLDSYETILQDNPIGSHRSDFRGYSELLQRIGNERHQSCLLAIGREPPREMLLGGDNHLIRTFQLGGLTEAVHILINKQLLDPGENWRILIEIYRGNPLALQIVTTIIKDLFGGSVQQFLKQNTTFLDRELYVILTEQFDRLSISEKEVLQQLAIAKTPASIDRLMSLTSDIDSRSKLMEILHSLQRRSLIEQQFDRGEIEYTLPPIVMKFVRKIYCV